MKLLKARICYAIRIMIQPIQNLLNRMRLKNKDFTIISSTCAGGIIYNRLGQKFLSPTVNLWFTEKDLQRLANNLYEYMHTDLKFVKDDNYNYPVALLKDIKIYFNHAKTEKEALDMWNRRRSRVNYDNIWLLSSDRNLGYEDIKKYGELPAKGKVMFTAKEYPEFDYCLCFKEYEARGDESVGEYMANHTPVMDHFVFEKYLDYVKWLNTGKVK